MADDISIDVTFKIFNDSLMYSIKQILTKLKSNVCESYDLNLCEDISRDPNLCEDKLRNPNLCEDTSRDPNLCEDTSRDPNLCEDTSRDPNLCEDTSRDPNLCEDTSRDPNLCEDTLIVDGEFLETLLLKPVDLECDEYQIFKGCIDKSNSSYPLYPIYDTVCKNLFHWIYYNKETFNSNQQYGLNKINYEFKDATRSCIRKIQNILLHKHCDEKRSETQNTNCINYTDTQMYTCIRTSTKTLLQTFRKSDVITILGLCRTQGSLDLLPPDLSTLWRSFHAQHHPKSKLTVGARALTKHCHRSSEKFWGVCTGSEDVKNKHAIEILKIILLDCSWINIHMLPHDVYVLEIRCSQGYGLRWKYDGSLFRGFLEPQMENGHEIGWRH